MIFWSVEHQVTLCHDQTKYKGVISMGDKSPKNAQKKKKAAEKAKPAPKPAAKPAETAPAKKK